MLLLTFPLPPESQTEQEPVCVRQVVVCLGDLCPAIEGLIRLTDGDNDCPPKTERKRERKRRTVLPEDLRGEQKHGDR